MEELKELQQAIDDEIQKVREEKENLPAIKDTNNNTEIFSVIKAQEQELLATKEVADLGKKFGEERIMADLKAEASRIRRQNIETAERDFDNETRELRLKHLKAELELEHKYNMETLEQDSRHTQMLDKRKKMVEKYGYLYDCSEEKTYIAKDSKGNEYRIPKDFSFSKGINKIRQFGRNVSKLDKPILQTIKWGLIIGVIVVAYILLK